MDSMRHCEPGTGRHRRPGTVRGADLLRERGPVSSCPLVLVGEGALEGSCHLGLGLGHVAGGAPFVRDALRAMRAARQSMAVVISDATRRPIGIVTLKDLDDPLTGELAAW